MLSMASPTPAPFTAAVPAGLSMPVFRTIWGRVALAVLGLEVGVVIVAAFGVAYVLMNLLFLPVLLIALAALWLGSLIEALSAPDPLWSRAGQSKVTFVLLIVLLALLGMVLYLAIARPSLRAAAQGA